MFSSNWFENLAKDNFETYIKPVFIDCSFNYLEIGTFEGASLFYMFENVMKNSGSKATVIDPFTFCHNQLNIFKSNINNYLDRTTVIQGLSQNELPKLIPDTFDVIYVDGDHTSEGVLTDANLAFPLLKSGGYMIFDDYLWIYNGSHTTDNINNPSLHNTLNPYTGINIFIEKNKELLEIVVSNWQVIIKKL